MNMNQPTYNSIGKMIKAKRMRTAKTAAALAKDVNLSRATISNIENENQGVGAKTLWLIAKALKCKSMDELYPPLDNPDPCLSQWLSISNMSNND